MLSKTTTTQLLADLVDSTNDTVWREFDARYRPILVAFSIRLGLSECDAADVAQEALTRFVRGYRAGKYDRTRGRLHSWLIGIAHHCAADVMQKHARQRVRRGESAIVQIEDREDQLTMIWEGAFQRQLLQRALAQLKDESGADPESLHAFELLAVRGSTPESVSQALSISRDKVYLIKHRCLKRLRSIVSQLAQAYEVNPESLQCHE